MLLGPIITTSQAHRGKHAHTLLLGSNRAHVVKNHEGLFTAWVPPVAQPEILRPIAAADRCGVSVPRMQLGPPRRAALRPRWAAELPLESSPSMYWCAQLSMDVLQLLRPCSKEDLEDVDRLVPTQSMFRIACVGMIYIPCWGPV